MSSEQLEIGQIHTLPALYIFLDEAGDLGFQPKGSQYFVLSAITSTRPFSWDAALTSYKYDVLEYGIDTQYFHAANDNSYVRSRVFDLIRANADAAQVDSLIVEKRKTHPTLQVEEKFYPRMLGYLLKYVLRKTALDRYAQVIVVTDTIPIKGQRQSMEKAIREALRALLPAGVVFKVLHHASKSCHGLQVADYCCWAIQKRWERGDSQMYDLIQPFLRSEYDIFKGGTEHFY